MKVNGMQSRQEQVSRPNRVRRGFLMPRRLTDRAWAAGFFDGEGYIAIRDRKFDHTPHKCIYVELILCNTNYQSIYRLRELFGGRIQFLKKRKSTWLDIWRWTASPNIARLFLKATFPYLLVKKEQAIIGLQILNSKDYRWTQERYDQDKTLHEQYRLLIKR